MRHLNAIYSTVLVKNDTIFQSKCIYSISVIKKIKNTLFERNTDIVSNLIDNSETKK